MTAATATGAELALCALAVVDWATAADEPVVVGLAAAVWLTAVVELDAAVEVTAAVELAAAVRLAAVVGLTAAVAPAPMAPVAAIVPNAIAKVVSATAATRWRILAIRRRRAWRRC